MPFGNRPSRKAEKSSTAVYQTGSAIRVKIVEEIEAADHRHRQGLDVDTGHRELRHERAGSDRQPW